MKKLIIGFLAIVIVAIVVLGGLFFQNYTVLHIPPEPCGYMLQGTTPEDFVAQKGSDTWLEGKYLFSHVDEDGCLILVLPNRAIAEWKNSLLPLQVLQCVLANRDLGVDVNYSLDFAHQMEYAETCGFEIADDYTKIVDGPGDNTFYFPLIMAACIEMQVFNGVPCSEIRVEYLEIDAEGKILDKVVFPDDVEDNADLFD